MTTDEAEARERYLARHRRYNHSEKGRARWRAWARANYDYEKRWYRYIRVERPRALQAQRAVVLSKLDELRRELDD